MRKRVAILGSTGSIGTQTLDVISYHPEIFEVFVITARHNIELLIEQAIRFIPKHVVVTNEKLYQDVSDALKELPTEVHTGDKNLSEIVRLEQIDIVLIALVGFAGLLPTIKALESGKDIALANKETLVVAGELITDLALKNNAQIYPVDSEHSAIFQCLVGEDRDCIEKIYLTASGGPFRGMSIEKLKQVTREQALDHPNWCMGNKVTIDSASLMNKGLETIEAKWLFDLDPEQVEVIVHPQSVIHSVVQFHDGSMKAQMGLPDMRLPIQYALGYPLRLPSDFPRFSFIDYPDLTFEKPDLKVFRNLALALNSMKTGGNMPCIMNAANEVAVDAFLNNTLPFYKMPDIIEQTMAAISFITHPSFDDFVLTDSEARRFAGKLI
jgi:1-deoxy-D-xylulose-5-phosphate reductoisomerase